ncbi:MAG: transglycosylase SLT domain-containing protein [Proteobacteria bacterium]|nr:transglycosylase SLT domain-containing protein [Pseudomonadota bacterium]
MKSASRNKHSLFFTVFMLFVYGLTSTQALAATPQEVNNQTRNILSHIFQPQNTYEIPGNSTEIWSRLRSRLNLGSNQSSQPLFQRHVKSFAKHQDYINMVIKNASPYLFYILEEVEKRGMPSEIALLPIIESDFNPHTLSHKGALGLWQIMPSLGKIHGLKQNASYDARKDVYESTKAALDHLQYLHKKFNGNWLLAIAAYNCGEARLARAMRQNKTNDFWALKLPKETMNFVPKLLAFAAIIKTPTQYGVVLPAIPNKPVIARVHMGKPIDIAHAARLVDISETQLRKLNPGIKKSASSGPLHLVVPVQHAENLKQKIGGGSTAPAASKPNPVATQDSSKKTNKNKTAVEGDTSKTSDVTIVKNSKTATTAKFHTVKKGESIPRISKKYGLNEDKVFKLNNLTHKSIIQPGQKIRLS